MTEQIKDKKIEATTVVKKQTARLSYLRVTPRKARAVIGLLKGLSVNEAEAQLVMQNRRSAKPILKLLRSAVASAVKNMNIAPGNLYVESIRVDQGPMLKRMLPRAKGMATPIQKKMSHVTLVLVEKSGMKEGRFKMQVKKKVKRVQEESKKEKKAKVEKNPTEHIQRNEPGFFKKVFRRKSMV